MKIKNFLLGLMAVTALFVGCQEKEEDFGEPVISLSKTLLEFDQAGGTQTIDLTATLAWALKDYDQYSSWLSISPESGDPSKTTQTITVKVTENTGVDREAAIQVWGNVLNNEFLTIKQTGAKGDGQNKTVAEFLAEKNEAVEYTLTGKVGDIAKSATYYGFTLKDETGEISCPFPTNWDDFSSQISTGGTVVIKGKYSYYEKKSQDQVSNGEIISFTAAAAEDIKSLTVTEFIAKADKFNLYRLKGTVASSVNATYCSFDLEDATGTITVYTVNNASEWGSKVKKGGTVTLRGAYTLYTPTSGSAKHEVVDAYIESFEEASGGDQPSGNAKGTGTLEDPFNAAGATKAASALEADTPSSDFYYIKGVVKKVKSVDTGTYGNANFYIAETTSSDDDFYCYQIMYLGGEKFTAEDQIKVGDEVVVYAQLLNYKGNTPETNGKGTGKLYSINGKTDGGTSGGDQGGDQGGEVADPKTVTVAEFLAAAESSTQPYQLTGVITGTINTTYGNFDLKDETGTVYVYGLTKTNLGYGASNDKSFSSLGLKAGDEVTIIGYRGSYNDKIEVLNAYYVSHKPGEGGDQGGDQGGDTTGDVSIEAGENEVLHALTLDEIKACLAKSTTASYTTVTIESAGGNWTGNIYNASANTFLQFRNNNASYLTSPEYSSKIKRIVIVTTESKFKQSSEKSLRVAAVPTVDPSTLPTGKDANNKNITYTDEQMANAYGSTSVNTKGGAQTLQIDVKGDAKQLSLLTIDGAMYLDAIYVFCEK